MRVIIELTKILLTHGVSVVVIFYENKVEQGSLFVAYYQNTVI